MPGNRQSEWPAEEDLVVRTLALSMPSGQRIEDHTHDWHQLIYAVAGAMTVQTAEGHWVVPPERAVWIPEGCEHSIRMTGIVKMRTLYFRPDDDVSTPSSCCVVQVSALLRELILGVLELRMLSREDPMQLRMALLLHDLIAQTPVAPLDLRLPTDSRALAVAQRAQRTVEQALDLRELTAGSGASVRTIERLFVAETGLTFGRWTQRLRALHALERLAAGDTVTQAGLKVGYESTSAFIAMFKRVLGHTPGSYYQEP